MDEPRTQQPEVLGARRAGSRRTCSRGPASAPRLRGEIVWDYDRAELIADGVVHAAGVVLGLFGAVAIVAIALRRGGAAPILIYAAALLAMLGASAAYNMCPVSPRKWLLRRFDHSAIYLLIAGTYTPFLAQMKGVLAGVMGVALWASAGLGIALKLLLPGRFDRLSVALYLLLGWSGLLLYGSFAAAVPRASVWLLGIGGIVYSIGVVFHAWEGLRFQNAIWHGFVLVAAICHYAAVVGMAIG
jgi:hemolysin III